MNCVEKLKKVLLQSMNCTYFLCKKMNLCQTKKSLRSFIKSAYGDALLTLPQRPKLKGTFPIYGVTVLDLIE